MHKEKRHIQIKGKGRSGRLHPTRLLAEAIRKIFPHPRTPAIIAVGGPGGIGKTTFAQGLAERLGDAALLPLDEYKTSREVRRQANLFGPHPEANRMELIAAHLESLRRGETIEKPVYDRITGAGSDTEPFTPAPWTIVEGEIATYSRFRELCDFSIFIDSDWRTQLETRLGRDMERRNYSLDKAVATFLHSNLREFVEHGAASKQWCDVHLFCDEDYRLALESVAEPLYEKLRGLFKDNVETLEMEGLTVPVLTPFKAEGSIDRQAFLKHIAWLSEAGVRRLLLAGTTGEFFSLNALERLELLKLALEYFPGLIWLQVGGGPLPEAQHLARRAAELGADGIFCLPPAFHADLPEQGIIRYIEAVAKSCDLPIMLYNFPKHTQNPLTATVLQSVDHFGVKDSGGDLSLIDATPRYFIGSNRDIPRKMNLGSIGFVSAAANIWPELYTALEESLKVGAHTESTRLQSQINAELEALGRQTPPELKKLLSKRIGVYPLHGRPPF